MNEYLYMCVNDQRPQFTTSSTKEQREKARWKGGARTRDLQRKRAERVNKTEKESKVDNHSRWGEGREEFFLIYALQSLQILHGSTKDGIEGKDAIYSTFYFLIQSFVWCMSWAKTGLLWTVCFLFVLPLYESQCACVLVELCMHTSIPINITLLYACILTSRHLPAFCFALIYPKKCVCSSAHLCVWYSGGEAWCSRGDSVWY